MIETRPGERPAPEIPGSTEEVWPDLPVTLEPPRPRIEPGVYFDRFERRGWGRKLILHFEIYDRNPLETLASGEARVLATLPAYFPLPAPGRPVPATSQLGRLYALLGTTLPRRDRLPLRVLRHRLWSVQVRDVRADSRQQPLHRRQWHSLVGDVVEHYG
jgi:hypothetical protein